jgi:hypothetical protein
MSQPLRVDILEEDKRTFGAGIKAVKEAQSVA